MNYEFRLAMLADGDIARCPAPLPPGWAQRFHIGDRVRMRSTRVVNAEYSLIPSGTFGTLVGVHSFQSVFVDTDNRETRPIEVEWNVAGMGITLADCFPRAALLDGLNHGYSMSPDRELTTIRIWMHPCHIHITRHNKSGYSVARLFAETTKWADHPSVAQ